MGDYCDDCGRELTDGEELHGRCDGCDLNSADYSAGIKNGRDSKEESYMRWNFRLTFPGYDPVLARGHDGKVIEIEGTKAEAADKAFEICDEENDSGDIEVEECIPVPALTDE